MSEAVVELRDGALVVLALAGALATRALIGSVVR